MERIIYRVENLINGLNYIGVTTKSIEVRKNDHYQKAINKKGYLFHEEILKFKEDSFKWSKIDTANCLDELAQKEKFYVIKYESKRNGYNSDSGGGFKKSVYKYNLEDGSLVNKFECLEDAGNSISTTKQHISRACLSVNKTFGGYY